MHKDPPKLLTQAFLLCRNCFCAVRAQRLRCRCGRICSTGCKRCPWPTSWIPPKCQLLLAAMHRSAPTCSSCLHTQLLEDVQSLFFYSAASMFLLRLALYEINSHNHSWNVTHIVAMQQLEMMGEYGSARAYYQQAMQASGGLPCLLSEY